MDGEPTRKLEPTEGQQSQQGPQPQQGAGQPGEAWAEVGQQFQQLGESLSAAFRAFWNNEQNRQRVDDVQTGLKSMVNQVGQAIDDTSTSPEAQQVRGEFGKAAESVRTAGEQTVQEVRPYLITALKQFNTALERFVNEVEGKEQSLGGKPDEPPPPPPPPSV